MCLDEFEFPETGLQLDRVSGSEISVNRLSNHSSSQPQASTSTPIIHRGGDDPGDHGDHQGCPGSSSAEDPIASSVDAPKGDAKRREGEGKARSRRGSTTDLLRAIVQLLSVTGSTSVLVRQVDPAAQRHVSGITLRVVY